MQLSFIEKSELQQCETIIEEGLRTFVDVGGALLKIRDKKLYRQEYSTFEEYINKRWDISKRHAYRLIDAANITDNLKSDPGVTLPQFEKHARPLKNLEPEEQREVWAEIVDTAPEGKITSKFVEEVVERKTKPHVSHNSGENEWYTPPEFIEAARQAMGSIDTDPASSDIANQTVKAKTYFTIEDNGLICRWTGNVWLNPPYSQPQVSDFTKLTVGRYLNGEIEQACILVNNATETEFFQRMLAFCSAVCFPKSRIKFIDPEGNPSGAPLQGQAILYFGENIKDFTEAFDEFGAVLYAN